VRYGVIYADPPWRFRTWSESNQKKAAKNHYDLMELADIKKLPVQDMAADDCVLLMWACNPMIPQALEVIEAWGFKYKTVAFTWAKQSTTGSKWHMGLGYWTRQNTEQCFLATRGKPKALAHDIRQLVISPRREHSRKPELHQHIERLSVGPYLEMFARTTVDGWDQYGNECDKFPQAAE
jgi:N6-adenosine-specific RNA methylase IME4